MSRINYAEWDDEYSELQRGRWERNSRAVLTSARGQAVLRDLEAALLALPVQELAQDIIAKEENGVVLACVLGAYALHKGVPPSEMEWLNDTDANEAADWASRRLGMAFTLAWNLIERNDEKLSACTPPERHRLMLEWVRLRIAPPEAGPLL